MSLKVTARVRKVYNEPVKAETLVIEPPFQSEYKPSKQGYYFDKAEIPNPPNTGLQYICDKICDLNQRFAYKNPVSGAVIWSQILDEDLDIIFTNLDTKNVTTMAQMFYYQSKITRVPYYNTRKTNAFYYMFANCNSLKIVPELDLREANATGLNNMFYNCSNLTEVWIRNIKINLQVGSGTSWGHLLTVESLVHLCNQLIDVGASRKLTVGSANLEKLASVYVKKIPITDEMRAEDDLIDEKLPCVVCESTDEGAMLISEYVTLKNWELG